MRFLLLAGCIGLAAGCASKPAPQPAPIVIFAAPPATLAPDNEPIRVTAAALGGDLGGAAYQVRGYRDVLRRDREGAFDGTAIDTSDLPYDAMSRQLDRVASSQSETDKALSPVHPAWQRYCNGGLNMTKADWDYVTKRGAPQGVPDRIAEDCRYPK